MQDVVLHGVDTTASIHDHLARMSVDLHIGVEDRCEDLHIGEDAVTSGAGVTSLAGVVSGRGVKVAPRGGCWMVMLTNPLDEVLVTGSTGELASTGSMATERIWM